MNSKYENIYKSITVMMAPLKKDRPDCEKLLVDQKLWALDKSEIDVELLLRNNENFFSENYSIEHNFCNYFVRKKLMHR
jgi:hypothetical protein